MFGSAILETAIGLALLYLLLSFICSAVNEAFAAMLKRRGRILREAITQLLDEPGSIAASDTFYDHPLITALRRRGTGLPSYIASDVFADVILDMLAPGDGGTPPKARLAAIEANLRTETSDAARSRLLESAEALLQRATDAGPGGADARLAEFRSQIEAWFDRTMDRATGWYRRHTQLWLTGIAALVTLLMNADSIALARSLYENPGLREAMVVAAENYSRDGGTGDQPPPDLSEHLRAITELPGLPLGWSETRDDVDAPTMVIGWLITVFAVSLGAPFWFQLISRLVSLRASGILKTMKPRSPE